MDRNKVVQIEKKLFQIGYVKMLSQPKELEKQNSQSIDEEREIARSAKQI